jgi:hypothetical protein
MDCAALWENPIILAIAKKKGRGVVAIMILIGDEMSKNKLMIFEGALCCSTGICGPEPNKALIELNESIKRLKSETPDLEIERASLSSNAEAFLKNPQVLGIVKTEGMEMLPITVFNGKIVAKQHYLSHDEVRSLINQARGEKK